MSRYSEEWRLLRQRCEEQLSLRLPPGDSAPQSLHSAMRYVSLDGGKRVRPLLVYLTGLAYGATLEQLDAPACAVELIHVYSLVHDDLPAMDNDDLRRGRPTCHRVWDEATAILVGDALHAQAFAAIASEERLTCQQRLAMVSELAQRIGAAGLVGGQIRDMAATGQTIDLDQLATIHHHKTGELIRAAVNFGAIAANASPTEQQQLDRFATAIGLAFQIRDDILDVTSDTATLGKQQGADAALHKATYPAIIGLAAAQQRLNEVHQQALEIIADRDQRADPLRAMADFIAGRDW
jgi:geranylgeranyl pyrophosphate synthase